MVLWFEHDSYDQLILAFVLDHLSRRAVRPAVELICVDTVPGVRDFIGLGQLTPERLRWLWTHRRRPVTERDLRLGRRVWRAVRTPDPRPLLAIARAGTPEIPPLARAIRRHLQELPSTATGLGLTQHLALQIIADCGPLTAGAAFRTLMREREPLPYLGDLMFWHVLVDLTRVERPLVEGIDDGDGTPWPRRVLTITETGCSVLAGATDFLTLYRSERWVGGVPIRADRPVPRWDPKAATIRPEHSVRPARPDEGPALTAVAHRAKAH